MNKKHETNNKCQEQFKKRKSHWEPRHLYMNSGRQLFKSNMQKLQAINWYLWAQPTTITLYVTWPLDFSFTKYAENYLLYLLKKHLLEKKLRSVLFNNAWKWRIELLNSKYSARSNAISQFLFAFWKIRKKRKTKSKWRNTYY